MRTQMRGNYVRLGEIGRPRWWVLKKFKEKIEDRLGQIMVLALMIIRVIKIIRGN